MDPKQFRYIIGIINENQHWTLTVLFIRFKSSLTYLLSGWVQFFFRV